MMPKKSSYQTVLMIKALVSISQFDFKVVGFCICLLKIWQVLSSATMFLVFLTFFG